MDVNVDTVLTTNISHHDHFDLAIFRYGIFSIETSCCITHPERDVARYITSHTLFSSPSITQ